MKEQIAEGKTKVIYSLSDEPHLVEIVSKDRITAGDGARAHDMAGKAVISTATTSKVFELLNKAGIRTHFVKQNGENSFVARKCAMVPIEWVARRIATGSFLKRNPGVKEGHRFSPLKLETFFKDDANHDPQWSREQLIAAELKVGGVTIGRHEVDIMSQTTITVFEILEKAWASLNCTLVDMKIEFGVDPSVASAEPHNSAAAILLADVIDADSWRLWPSGDRRLMKDKQVYRELKEVTGEALEQVKLNFQWIADKLKELTPDVNGRTVVLMGSPADVDHCQKIKKGCESFGIPCTLRVSSAHKSVGDTLQIASDYESDGIPTVIIAVAGRSNGLGPVLSGHTTFPVINCPPVTADWGSHEIWSSLRLPSGLGCSTVLSPEAATLSVAQIIGLTNHTVWAKLRAQQLNQRISLEEADRKFQAL